MGTFTTFGAYEEGSVNVDSHSGNTSITSTGLNGGAPNSNSWIGFVAEVTAGTGTGSATITGWDDGTDTITLGTGITGLADDDTVKIRCEHNTMSSSAYDGNAFDCYSQTSFTNLHGGASSRVRCENDVTGGTPLKRIITWYIPFEDKITAGYIINSAKFLFIEITNFFSGTATFIIGQNIDSSVSPSSAIPAYEGIDDFNTGATWDYKDDGISRDWEADSSISIEDVLSAVEPDSVTLQTSTIDTWQELNIQPIVENFVTDGDDNIGMYSRISEDDPAYTEIHAHKNTTTNKRWFSIVEYSSEATGWTGKINGVTNPGKVNGIAVADISKVNGVE